MFRFEFRAPNLIPETHFYLYERSHFYLSQYFFLLMRTFVSNIKIFNHFYGRIIEIILDKMDRDQVFGQHLVFAATVFSLCPGEEGGVTMEQAQTSIS